MTTDVLAASTTPVENVPAIVAARTVSSTSTIKSFSSSSFFHELSHPSPSKVLPSSHSSFPITIPSPHVGDQTDWGVPAWVSQEYPVSIVQLDVHPSPLMLLPSSHPSSDPRVPVPQPSM